MTNDRRFAIASLMPRWIEGQACAFLLFFAKLEVKTFWPLLLERLCEIHAVGRSRKHAAQNTATCAEDGKTEDSSIEKLVANIPGWVKPLLWPSIGLARDWNKIIGSLDHWISA